MKKYVYLLMLMTVIFAGCGNNSTGEGYTSIVEGTSVQVPALTGGEIKEFRVDTGQEVQPGEVLAVVDTTELVFRRRQLQASLEELEVQWEIARSNLEQAESTESYVREKKERIEALYQKSSASRQSVDDLINQLQQAQTALANAKQTFQSLVARKKQLIAQLGVVNKKIKDAVMVAPTGGIISEKYFELGEAIPPLSPIVEIIEIRKVEVKIYISEKKLPEVKYGQEARVTVDGLEKELNGTLSWVSPKAEFTPKTILTPETRTSLVYAVKISVPNPEGILKHGMPVEVFLVE
jgi:HlyD family secretion protein